MKNLMVDGVAKLAQVQLLRERLGFFFLQKNVRVKDDIP